MDSETNMDDHDPDDLAPDCNEPGDDAPEDLLSAVTPPDEIVPDEIDMPDSEDEVT